MSRQRRCAVPLMTKRRGCDVDDDDDHNEDVDEDVDDSDVTLVMSIMMSTTC
jgi:hypothetical protein